MERVDLTIEGCRDRQKRLLDQMKQLELSRIVLSSIENIQWLTGYRATWFFSPVATMDDTGKVTLIAAHKAPEKAAADVIERFDAKWHSTLRNDQRSAASTALLETIGTPTSNERVGVEFASAGLHLAHRTEAELIDIDPTMYQLRRQKHEDELACLQVAIDATEQMYVVARDMIKPGVTELDVFNALQTAAVNHCGEMLTGTGNDYQVASRGGAPRSGKSAKAGELYILDLGPAYRGYFADNARTIAVTEPTAAQQAAWDKIQEVFQLIESEVKPGKSCKELFDQAQAILDGAQVGIFNHHLGHGIGLFPHEAPHLNPNWDDTFQVGEVFTAEPGLYDEELAFGMRLENDYVVTENGVRNLSPFPLQL